MTMAFERGLAISLAAGIAGKHFSVPQVPLALKKIKSPIMLKHNYNVKRSSLNKGTLVPSMITIAWNIFLEYFIFQWEILGIFFV